MSPRRRATPPPGGRPRGAKGRKPRKPRSCLPIPARGRPSAYSPELARIIVAAIEAGNYIETAAALAGLNKATLYDWLKQGAQDPTGPYGPFSDAIRRARAVGESADLAKITRAANDPKLWKAAAWKLERRNPGRWSKRVKADKGDADKIPELFRMFAALLLKHLPAEQAREIVIELGRQADETFGPPEGMEPDEEQELEALEKPAALVPARKDDGGEGNTE